MQDKEENNRCSTHGEEAGIMQIMSPYPHHLQILPKIYQQRTRLTEVRKLAVSRVIKKRLTIRLRQNLLLDLWKFKLYFFQL